MFHLQIFTAKIQYRLEGGDKLCGKERWLAVVLSSSRSGEEGLHAQSVRQEHPASTFEILHRTQRRPTRPPLMLAKRNAARFHFHAGEKLRWSGVAATSVVFFGQQYCSDRTYRSFFGTAGLMCLCLSARRWDIRNGESVEGDSHAPTHKMDLKGTTLGKYGLFFVVFKKKKRFGIERLRCIQAHWRARSDSLSVRAFASVRVNGSISFGDRTFFFFFCRTFSLLEVAVQNV